MKYGLALSGGAARGIAHLGVLQALEEKHVDISVLSGISAGSIVAVLHAQGFNAQDILNIFSGRSFYQMFGWNMPKTGLFSMEGMLKILRQNLRFDRMEDLNKPVFIGATNLLNGKLEYFSEGPILEIVEASCSVPLLFKTSRIDEVPYTDGGIVCNLPSEVLKGKCEKIIGSDVLPIAQVDDVGGLQQTAARVLSIIAGYNSQKARDKCDILISPEELSGFSFTDLHQEKELFQIGYNHTIEIDFHA
jgi:NTE family protein